jgi:hypothetical protein
LMCLKRAHVWMRGGFHVCLVRIECVRNRLVYIECLRVCLLISQHDRPVFKDILYA